MNSMKFNWFICVVLLGLLVFASDYAADLTLTLLEGAESETAMYQRGLHIAVIVGAVWLMNMGLYTIMAAMLPVHPFLRQSLLVFKKKTTAMFIVFLSLIGYCVSFVGMAEYPLAIGCLVAGSIAWEKVRFPYDFYKAHVEEYEGILEEKKSKEPIDNDKEDH